MKLGPKKIPRSQLILWVQALLLALQSRVMALRPYVFFDCDDCCYQNNWKTAKRITDKISLYTEQLGVSKQKSYDLYKTHGTCLKGLLAEGIINDHRVEEYLHTVHDIDYSDIDADPPLRDMIASCVSRECRFVFTASTKEHASRCLNKVLAPSTVDDLFSAIVDTRTCKLDTKHSTAAFRCAMDAVGVPLHLQERDNAACCILIDDSVSNIKAAKEMGWTTVLVGKTIRETGLCFSSPPEADHHIATLHDLPSAMPHLFLNFKESKSSLST